MNGYITVGVDGSAPANAAVDWAAADAHRRNLSLRLVHVCEQWVANVEEATAPCRAALAAAVDRARALAPVTTAFLIGNAVEVLIKESAEADTVVLGSRGLGGFAGLVLGSVSIGVAGHAAGPVVVVRSPGEPERAEVVAGFDGSEELEIALEFALDQARARGDGLRVVYTWQIPIYPAHTGPYAGLMTDNWGNDSEGIRRRLETWQELNLDVPVRISTRCEHPVPALADAAREAALVVVGSRVHGGFASALLGSVSHGLLHHADCPVAVVRPREDKQGKATAGERETIK
jgi:nucleotide-binding universal stress UspA family protein